MTDRPERVEDTTDSIVGALEKITSIVTTNREAVQQVSKRLDGIEASGKPSKRTKPRTLSGLSKALSFFGWTQVIMCGLLILALSLSGRSLQEDVWMVLALMAGIALGLAVVASGKLILTIVGMSSSLRDLVGLNVQILSRLPDPDDAPDA